AGVETAVVLSSGTPGARRGDTSMCPLLTSTPRKDHVLQRLRWRKDADSMTVPDRTAALGHDSDWVERFGPLGIVSHSRSCPGQVEYPPEPQSGGSPVSTPIVLIPGDGIGPEVTTAAKAVVEAAGAQVQWIEAAAGVGALERFGDPLPQATLDLIRRYR